MAPEQTGRMNRSIDSRSDLYACGITLYETITGSLPFSASDPLEWIHCHIARPPNPPSERVDGLPGPIEDIIQTDPKTTRSAQERENTSTLHHAQRSSSGYSTYPTAATTTPHHAPRTSDTRPSRRDTDPSWSTIWESYWRRGTTWWCGFGIGTGRRSDTGCLGGESGSGDGSGSKSGYSVSVCVDGMYPH